MSTIRHLNFASAQGVIFPLMTLAVVAVLVAFPLSDPDVYWHIANGREMLSQGRIINEEIFSFTAPGTTFSNHEWLSQVLWFVVYENGGGESLNYLKIVLTLCVVGFLYPTCRFVGASHALAFLICVGAILGGLPRYTPRPELFSLLGIAVLGFILYGFRSGRLPTKALYLLPLIMVLWDWLHGAIFGAVFLLAFVAGENIRYWIFRWPTSNAMLRGLITEPSNPEKLRNLNYALAATVGAMLIHPWGLPSYGIFFAFLGNNPLVESIKEFQITEWSMNPAFWIFFTVTALMLALNRKRTDITQLFVVLPFAYLALRYARGMGVFSLVAAPIVANALAYHQQRVLASARGKVITVALWIIASTTVTAYAIYIKAFSPDWLWHFSTSERRDGFPLGSVNFVKEVGLRGNMYNSGDVGGYLSFFITPERKIFQYNHHTVFRDYYRYTQNPRELDRWSINFAIVEVWNELPDMFPRATWAPVYNEQSVAVVLRRIPENQKIIDQYEIRYFQPHRLTFESLSRFAKNPKTYERLLHEMANYLAFREDSTMTDLFVEYLQNPPAGSVANESLALLMRAAKRNGENKKLQGALRL